MFSDRTKLLARRPRLSMFTDCVQAVNTASYMIAMKATLTVE